MIASEKQQELVMQVLKSDNANTNAHKLFINKLNKFHKHNLLDIIQVYANDYKNKRSLELANLNVILFDESHIKFNYLRGVKDDVDVVIETPYDFVTSDNVTKIKTIQDYFEELSVSSASKMKRSHKQVKNITYPTSNLPSILLFLLIQLPIILMLALKSSVAARTQISSLFNAKIENVFITLYALIGLTFLIHVVEILALNIFGLWSFHRVPMDIRIEHFVFAMLEGFPHHKRFNKLVKKVKESGFYDLDVEEADNII